MRTAKAWVAAAGLLVTALSSAFADDVFDGSDTVAVVTTVASIAVSIWAVYQTPNKPDLSTQPLSNSEPRTY